MEAIGFLKLGIDKQNSLALHALAVYTLEYKKNLSKSDAQEALAWLNQAAESNFAPSLQALAGIYENGLYGIKANIDHGLNLRIKAAETGSKEAQYTLGILVYKGNGFKQNRSHGLDLIKKSAAQGHSEAIHFIKSIES